MRELVTTDPARAAECLGNGGLAALPTETVYGLAADAEQVAAVRRVFAVKGRPAGHPLIVHLGDPAALDDWAVEIPEVARDLVAACWPGPLTVLLRRSPRVSDDVTGGRDTVGLRVPAHPGTAGVLARLGDRAVAAPSANRFGRVSPTSAGHVVADLGDRLDAHRDCVLDGGPATIGVESTIVDCTGVPQILRPGGISTDAIEAIVAGPLAPRSGPSRAAGMLAGHYAPRAAVHVVAGPDAAAALERALTGRTVAGRTATVRIIDGRDDLVAWARTLYADLRRADDDGIDHVVAVRPPAEGLGHALRDRLAKAAASAPTR